ncbi:MAG: DUF5666 domain-containing protein [Candidatus Thiodiazotropha sp.]|jgi:hypothetical protein
MKCSLTKLLVVASSLLLTSCGGGGGTVAEGGIGGSGISMGRVAQVGSVYVNGTQYNTDNTQFIIDGDNTSTLNDIGVGMVVRVTGSRDTTTNTGVAESVVYDSLLLGPVDVIFNSSTSHIGVMGQAVHINEDTVFENTILDDPQTLETLALNALVEVSGFPDTQTGEILATRVELKSSVSTYKVSGIASDVDPNNISQFDIGGLTIDASSSISSIPAAGSYVAVESSLPPDTSSTPPLFTPESISIIGNGDGTVAADGAQVDMEGVITSGLDSNDLFVVNGQIVDASLTPLSGETLQLAAGRVVEIDGVMNGTILLAETITLEVSTNEREELAALLQSGAVNIAASTVTIMGKTIHITNSTIFENDLGGSSTFSLSDLAVGDYLEAKVYDNNGELTATKLELEDPPHHYNAELEGIPSSLGGNTIEILGLEIDTNPSETHYHFDPNDIQRIEVKGNYDPVSGTVTATSIENDH